MALLIMLGCLCVVPIGGQPVCAYPILKTAHGIHQVVKRVHHQKKLRRRGPVQATMAP